MTTNSMPVRRALLATAVVGTVGFLSCRGAPGGDEQGQGEPAAAAPEVLAAPEIQTPIGTLTVTSVEVADQYPSWCTPGAPPAYSGAPQCIPAEGGDRFLIIQIRNPEADRNADLIRSLKADYDAVTVFSDDGTEWRSALKEWRIAEGFFLIRYGPGTPESFVMTWPGNDPIELRPAGGG